MRKTSNFSTLKKDIKMSDKRIISGLQKLTLLDYPGKLACTVFTAGCNFACPFCHNAMLIDPESANYSDVDAEKVLAFLKKRTATLEGVCITGGEPLLFNEIFDFIKEVKKLGFPVKLDTNGSFPDRLIQLVEEKLIDYVAMDIKNSPDKYLATSGISSPLVLEKVKQSVDFLLQKKIDFEFRTTVVAPLHTPSDFIQIGQWIKGADKYFLQPFTNSGNILNLDMDLKALPQEELEQCLSNVQKFVPNASIRGQ
jgi:pyruvate formate lyase activating enzyme